MANGDFTHRIEADYAGVFDRLKQNANQTSQQLAETIGQVSGAAGMVRDAASEISSGSNDLASRTEQQAASLEERSEEHTSELQSLMRISYAVFCLKKNK